MLKNAMQLPMSGESLAAIKERSRLLDLNGLGMQNELCFLRWLPTDCVEIKEVTI